MDIVRRFVNSYWHRLCFCGFARTIIAEEGYNEWVPTQSKNSGEVRSSPSCLFDQSKVDLVLLSIWPMCLGIEWNKVLRDQDHRGQVLDFISRQPLITGNSSSPWRLHLLIVCWVSDNRSWLRYRQLLNTAPNLYVDRLGETAQKQSKGPCLYWHLGLLC